MEILNDIKSAARKDLKSIVLPESQDERILQAADRAISEELANIILVGNPSSINKDAKHFNLKNIHKATIINPSDHDKKDAYAHKLYELRKHKGLTEAQAQQLIEDPLYLAGVMIKSGDADGEVAGASNATRNVLRAAFQVVKTKPGISVVSGSFMMILNDITFGHNGLMFYADCGVNVNPNAEQLAEIAVSTAKCAKALGKFEPIVAMLSFSTHGSADDPESEKVREAAKIAKQKAPDLKIDGELQADAALIESVANKKAPHSEVAGNANVMIFPSLNAGNIAYKLTQYLGGAVALGPLLQGIAAPVNDLSRGCSIEDIVNVIAITSIQSNID
jgi:phosphate acetyltransferase